MSTVRKPKQVTVGDEKYVIGFHLATDGYMLIEAMTLLLLPTLASLTGKFDYSKLSKLKEISKKKADEQDAQDLEFVKDEISKLDLSDTAAIFVHSMSTGGAVGIVQMLMKCVTHNSHSLVTSDENGELDTGYFDLHFQGRYIDGLKLAWEVVKHNGFFGQMINGSLLEMAGDLMSLFNQSSPQEE